MKTVLFLVPHLSTGGMPQYTYDLMRKIKDDVNVYCLEYSFISSHFIVQRNRIIDLLGEKFFSLGDDKDEIFKIIRKIDPDIIHLQEMPEYFLDASISSKLYSSERRYMIIETSHDSSFVAENKRFFPDHFALISEYQKKEFSKLRIPVDLVEADIEYKERQDRNTGLLNLGLDPKLKHVLNVGLFTSRKNQLEAIQYATLLQDFPIQFHFVGNLADNFKSYWEPILQNLPPNVKIWGERSDVDNFYSCMDMMLFTSRGNENDKETSPLVIRESIGYNLPALIFNLPVYMGMYDKYDTITYMDFKNIGYNIDLIKSKLGLVENELSEKVFETLDGPINFEKLKFPSTMYESIVLHGDSAGMWWGTFIYKELDKGGISVEEGDVFVDLGANIGISSYYASKSGAKRIYCFEPDKKVLSLLEKNLSSHHVSFNFAISKNKENIELYHWPFNDENVGPKYSVDTIDLNGIFQLVDEPIIDYLKMDIEGFEEDIFDNVSQNVTNRIRKMFIEHHNKQTTDIFVEKLNKLGFDVFLERGNGQDYCYCTNRKMKNYDKSLSQVFYDNQSNKINFSFNRDVKNLTATIRDMDSHTVIWSSKFDLVPANQVYWMIPIPKSYYDFESEKNFGGFIVDFYEGDKIVSSKSFRIKILSTKKDIVRVVNNTEPIYFNYNEFFTDRIYDKFFNGKSFRTVVDVGASLGLWSEYIRSIANVNHVYMIEPNKTASSILKETYENDENTTLVEAALSNTDGEIQLFTNLENSLVSSIMEEHKKISTFGGLHQSEVIQGLTLSSFIEQNSIDKINLLKLDVEGAEYDILESVSEKDFSKIDNILLEYHISENKSIEDVNGIIRLLESNYFTCDLNHLNSGGGFIFATKEKTIEKKIKAVQFLLNGDYQKQKESIENVSKLQNLGIEYVNHFNDVYIDLPPASKSNRPHDVSMELKPNALTPAHYGCYDSFKTAVLSEFDSDLDFFIVMEGDAKIQDYSLFKEKLIEAMYLIEKHNLGFVSFGGIYDLEMGVLQSNVVEDLSEDFFICDKIIGCQFLIFPASSRKLIKDILITEKWDALDIYLNNVSHKYGIRVGVSRKTLVTQYDGISTIDNVVKQFKEFSV